MLEGSLINRATIIIQTRTDISGSAATGDSFRHETLHMLSHHGAARAHRVKTRPPSLVLSSGSPRAPHSTVHAACPRNGRETCAFTRLQPPRAQRGGGAMPPCSLLSPTVLCQPARSVALGRARRLLAAPRDPPLFAMHNTRDGYIRYVHVNREAQRAPRRRRRPRATIREIATRFADGGVTLTAFLILCPHTLCEGHSRRFFVKIHFRTINSREKCETARMQLCDSSQRDYARFYDSKSASKE